MSPWVNFKKLRESLNFAQVLQDYDVEVTVKGDQATGFCPLPGHKGRSERKSRSFSVNLKKGIFQCFGCQAKGNVLDFAALMEELDPRDPKEFRQAALRLQSRYLAADTSAQDSSDQVEEQVCEPGPDEDPEDTVDVVVNAPLGFQLKNLETDHPYLQKRDLTPETVRYFGLGYCTKGMMKGRVVIPLHDTGGELIGYAGRRVDDESVGDDTGSHGKRLVDRFAAGRGGADSRRTFSMGCLSEQKRDPGCPGVSCALKLSSVE